MPIAVLSDVHANLTALHSVLWDAQQRKVERHYFLGDAVGYGPDPNECVMLIGELATHCVIGNHDAAVANESERFNRHALDAINWTRAELTPQNKALLAAMPLTTTAGDALLVHASPYEPEAWHYLSSASSAVAAAGHFTKHLCLIGHSHVPFIAEITATGRLVRHEETVEFKPDSRYIINAGSVGQPRDGDPRASYVLLHDERAELVRVEYNVTETQHRMLMAGLPEPLIRRLALGY